MCKMMLFLSFISTCEGMTLSHAITKNNLLVTLNHPRPERQTRVGYLF